MDWNHSSRALSVRGASLPQLKNQSGPLLIPTRLSGREAIGELFEYRLELKTADVPFYQLPNDSAAGLDLDSLIGQEVTIGIEMEGKRGTYQSDGSPLGAGEPMPRPEYSQRGDLLICGPLTAPTGDPQE